MGKLFLVYCDTVNIKCSPSSVVYNILLIQGLFSVKLEFNTNSDQIFCDLV